MISAPLFNEDLSVGSREKTAAKDKCPLRIIRTFCPFEKGSVASFL
jgi:hypothetical protein